MVRRMRSTLFLMLFLVTNSSWASETNTTWLLREVFLGPNYQDMLMRSGKSLAVIRKNQLEKLLKRPLSDEEYTNLESFHVSLMAEALPLEKLISAFAPVLEERFTRNELTELRQFYGSPLGIKMRATKVGYTNDTLELQKQIYGEKYSSPVLEKKVREFFVSEYPELF